MEKILSKSSASNEEKARFLSIYKGNQKEYIFKVIYTAIKKEGISNKNRGGLVRLCDAVYGIKCRNIMVLSDFDKSIKVLNKSEMKRYTIDNRMATVNEIREGFIGLEHTNIYPLGKEGNRRIECLKWLITGDSKSFFKVTGKSMVYGISDITNISGAIKDILQTEHSFEKDICTLKKVQNIEGIKHSKEEKTGDSLKKVMYKLKKYRLSKEQFKLLSKKDKSVEDKIELRNMLIILEGENRDTYSSNNINNVIDMSEIYSVFEIGAM